MKFDYTIMNPPYNKNLHLKFLERMIQIADTVVSIQPSNWLFGNRKNKHIIDKIKNAHSNIERIINPGKYFDAVIGNDLSINYIDFTKDKKIIIDNITVNNFEEITAFITDNNINKFNHIISEFNKDNIWSHIKNYENNNIVDDNTFCVKIPRIRGHNYSKTGKSDDFYTLFSNNDTFTLSECIGKFIDLKKGSKRSKLSFYIPFESKNEAVNFINYCKTDFARTCFLLLKISQNVTSGRIPRKIPWQDFTDPIFSKSPSEIDDYLFKKYNISDKIRSHIEEILPDYYGIRKKTVKLNEI